MRQYSYSMFRADSLVCGLSTLWAVTEKHFLSEIPVTLSLPLNYHFLLPYEYDSKTSQSKSLWIGEVKAYRKKLYQFLARSKLRGSKTSGNPDKKKLSKPLRARALNTYLTEKLHKCSHCGYFFSIMPELEGGKAYFVKMATCPKCGNVDEVLRSYQGWPKIQMKTSNNSMHLTLKDCILSGRWFQR